MVHKYTLAGILLAAVVLGIAPAWSVAAPDPAQRAQAGTELLTNPGFEGLSCPGQVPSDTCKNYTHNVHVQDGILRDNIETPEGWVTWWRESDDYHQPEIVLMPVSNPNYTGERPRIRSGFRAVKSFTYFKNHDAGFYQVVTGLKPGAAVQFSVYAHSWSCDSMDGDNGWATSCGDPWNLQFQIGIEPNGVADPFAPGIIWSPEQIAPDVYQFIGPLTARVGASGSVAVFLRSRTKWAVEHNDAYWDDASLVYATPTAAPTSTPQTVAPTGAPQTPPPTATPGGPTSTPRPTPTPRPDGAVVHVVESGDTLSGIALLYGVDVDQIRQLNAGSIGDDDLIIVGQELVISAPAPTPSPTSPPTSIPTSTPASTPTSPPTPPPASPTPEASPASMPTVPTDAATSQPPTSAPETAGENAAPGSQSTASNAFSTVAKISGAIALILVAGLAVLFFLTRRKR